MKKFFSVLFFVLLLSSIFIGNLNAIGETSFQDDKVHVYFFWAEGCPHCADEKVFLDKIKDEQNIVVHSLEVTKNPENMKLLIEAGKTLNADVSGVPFTVIGNKYIIGWYNEQTTGSRVLDAIECIRDGECPAVLGCFITEVTPDDSDQEECESDNAIPEKINLPFFGEIETKDVSLPLLTIIIAGLDGFNPCAMWVLLFLITLLLGMENRKKMWLFGGVFIASSAFVYFLFLAAWLNVFLFLGFVFWVRLGIGSVALWAGYYNLKEYYTNPSGGCKVTSGKKRQLIFEKIKKIIHEKHFAIALGGIILLAFAVNLVELVCSAGLPAVYTQVLSLSNLSTAGYYSYLLLYVIIFMLDDMLVFTAAMITLKITGVSTKYTRYSHLIGGIIMLILGALLILKPEWLMFG